MSNQYNSSAVGTGPAAKYADGRTVETSGLVPSFPSTDNLEKTVFKVVVGSWKRLNMKQTQTNDFEVNLTTYVPKQSLVTRVQLVDVDIPNTQWLIEKAWNRLYFDMGIAATSECRSISLISVSGSRRITAIARLPLPVTQLSSFVVLGPDTVQFNSQTQLPTPLDAIVHAWTKNNLQLSLVGIPGLGMFPLVADQIESVSNLSFVVRSFELALALTNAATTILLVADPIPGPVQLASILSYALTCAWADALEVDFQAQISIAYNGIDDSFCLKVPIGLGIVTSVQGELAEYMGIGGLRALDIQQMPLQGHSRFKMGNSYAALQTGDPHKPETLVRWVQDAFNTFSWPSFSFGLGFPGVPAAIIVTIPGGQMDLLGIASQINGILAAVPGLPYSVTCSLLTKRRLQFTGTGVFTMDWTIASTDIDVARLGFDPVRYPLALMHTSTFSARHIASLPAPCGYSCCGDKQWSLPPCLVDTFYRKDTGQLVLQTRPYDCFDAVLTQDPESLIYTFTTAVVGYVPGLQPGMSVVLTAPMSALQVPAIVVSPNTFLLVNPSDSVELGAAVTICPTSLCPLNIYLQRSNPRAEETPCVATAIKPYGCTIDPEVLGFEPITYSSCNSVLISPGTVEICQDSYILLCLAFQGGNAIPCVGDVYYPFQANNNSSIVFAKVLRSSFLRSDFERVFDHVFAGAGQPLSYIRVQILNPNGTPYQTHNHAVSVTLRFDAKQSYVAFGAGRATLADEGYLEVVPLSRGSAVRRR